MTQRRAPQSAAPRELDPDLVAACERLRLDLSNVLAWGVYADRIVVIASDGRKWETSSMTHTHLSPDARMENMCHAVALSSDVARAEVHHAVALQLVADHNDGVYDVVAIDAGTGNGWRFDAAVIERAVPLFQRVNVYLGHAGDADRGPNGERKPEHLAGVFAGGVFDAAPLLFVDGYGWVVLPRRWRAPSPMRTYGRIAPENPRPTLACRPRCGW